MQLIGPLLAGLVDGGDGTFAELLGRQDAQQRAVHNIGLLRWAPCISNGGPCPSIQGAAWIAAYCSTSVSMAEHDLIAIAGPP